MKRLLLILTCSLLLTGCIDRYSYRPVDPYWGQTLYPAGYGNHYQFTPWFDRVYFNQPAGYR